MKHTDHEMENGKKCSNISVKRYQNTLRFRERSGMPNLKTDKYGENYNVFKAGGIYIYITRNVSIGHGCLYHRSL